MTTVIATPNAAPLTAPERKRLAELEAAIGRAHKLIFRDGRLESKSYRDLSGAF